MLRQTSRLWKFTKDVANSDERQRQVACCAAQHEHDVKLGSDAFADASHGGAQFLSNQGVAKAG
eukprot:341721-Pleurochrysis_carterae.AAC.1